VLRTLTWSSAVQAKLASVKKTMAARFTLFAQQFQQQLQVVHRRVSAPQPLSIPTKTLLLDQCKAFVNKHAWCLKLNDEGVLQPIRPEHKTLYGRSRQSPPQRGQGGQQGQGGQEARSDSDMAQMTSQLARATISGNTGGNGGTTSVGVLTAATSTALNVSSANNTITAHSDATLTAGRVAANTPPAAATAATTPAIAAIKQEVVEELTFILTGDPWSPYTHGFVRNLYKYPLLQQCDWIVVGFHETHKWHSLTPDLKLVNTAFQGQHRFGWSLVLEKIKSTHFNLAQPLILDTYTDKTFHWAKAFYHAHDVIPYRQPWIGFLHHTCYTGEKYNCVELFRDRFFQQSLVHCKGLIVLSQYLHDQIRSLLDAAGHKPLPLHTLVHPTEVPAARFSWERFQQNKQRTLLHVGYWLRRFRSFYELQLPSSSPVQIKAILRPPGQSDDRFRDLYQDWRAPGSAMVLHGTEQLDRVTTDLATFACHMRQTVKLIDYVGNQDYDELLSANIVFIHLSDASAVNTVLECIVRATPILVNGLPAVKEMLGPDYPLYFSTLAEAEAKLAQPELLRRAHLYLETRHAATRQFSPEDFMTRLRDIVEQAAC
jgi:hypothetical protein